MKRRVFEYGDLAYVRENGNPLYLAVVWDDVNSTSGLIPCLLYTEYLKGNRSPYLVFARNLHGALWTFTGYVEEPHDAFPRQ